jgi:hypothetical protein
MLKGNFESTFLASILQLLCNEKKTGVLRLADHDGNEVKIYIHDGAVIHALSSRREMRLGELLRAKGAVTVKQLQRAAALSAEKHQTLGKTLVSEGFITLDLLKRIIKEQAETVIYNVFLWEKGTFEYQDAAINLKGTMLTRLNIMNLILEASRRIDEIALIRQTLPEDRMVFRIAEKVQQRGEITFSAGEWRVLSLIDGTRSLRKVIDDCLIDDFQALKIIHGLLQAGFIEPSESSAPERQLSLDTLEAIASGYAALLELGAAFLARELRRWPYMVFAAPAEHPPEIAALHAKSVQLWTRKVLSDCRPEAGSPAGAFFERLDPRRPFEACLPEALAELRQRDTPEAGRQLLVDGFNECLANLLQRAALCFGIDTTRELIQRLAENLPSVEAFEDLRAEKRYVLNGIRNILVNAEMKLKDKRNKEFKSIGLFAIWP